MIVSRVQIEFTEACWAVAGKSSERVKRVFGKVAMGVEEPKMEEKMSLGELLYSVLVGEGVGV